MIGLGKQIIYTKVVSFNLLTRILDLCSSASKVQMREYTFQRFFFLYFMARIALTPSIFFVNIKKDKPP